MYQNLGDIIRVSATGAWIPIDKANTDYQQYLAWVAEGNEPETIDLTQ